MKDVTDAIKHLDDEIQKRVKSNLERIAQLYEARNFKQAAASLEEGMKLQAFQPVLAYNLALCYHQLGEREQGSRISEKRKTRHRRSQAETKVVAVDYIFSPPERAALH